MSLEQIKQLRKELASNGGDPFSIAALVLQHNERLKQRIDELEAKLQKYQSSCC